MLVRGDPSRVEGADVLGEPVGHLLSLGLEGAEEPVPDDQDAAVVAIEVLPVGTVVDPVVRRSVEHGLGCTEPIDGFGVDPELVEEVHPPGGRDELR